MIDIVKYKSMYFMKKRIYLLMLILLPMFVVICFTSCDDPDSSEIFVEDPSTPREPEEPEEPEVPKFNVTVEDKVYSVGEPIRFIFTGTTGDIEFYSGEKGFRYEYRNQGEKFRLDKVEFKFVSQLSNMKGIDWLQRKILLSTDFSGENGNPSILNENEWIDVTSKFTLATSNTETSSGTVDLIEYVEEDKPMYIAYQYIHGPLNADQNAPSWRMKNIYIDGYIGSEKLELGKLADSKHTAGFEVTDFGKGTPAQSIALVNSSQVRLEGSKGVNVKNEVWVISKALQVSHVNGPVETHRLIQSLGEEQLENYRYTFDKEGEYHVVLVGKTPNAEGTEVIEEVFEFTIKVIP